MASEREEGGSLYARTWLGQLHKEWDKIGTIPVFEPTYPTPIEDALFVLLLSFVKEPIEPPWKPFAVPWIYSFTDDPFAEAPRAPDPSALTWTFIGEPGEEFEVPDQSEFFEITQQTLEALKQRWRKLQVALARTGTDQANFHPLTKHFFVKALAEEGIDEIVANISSMEATLQLPNERNRTKLMERYARLIGNKEAYQWLDKAYELRKRYLHSLGEAKETITWGELAQARWSLAKAIDGYLDLTNQRGELNREGLLHSLKE